MNSNMIQANILNKTIKSLQEIIQDNTYIDEIASIKAQYININNVISNYFNSINGENTPNANLTSKDASTEETTQDTANNNMYTNEDKNIDYAAEIHSVMAYLQWLLIEYKKQFVNNTLTHKEKTDILVVTDYIKSIDQIDCTPDNYIKVVFKHYPVSFVRSKVYSKLPINVVIDIDRVKYNDLTGDTGPLSFRYTKDIIYQTGYTLPIRWSDVYITKINKNTSRMSSSNSGYNKSTMYINPRNKFRYGTNIWTTDATSQEAKYSLKLNRNISKESTLTLQTIDNISTLLGGVLTIIAPDITREFISILNKYIGNIDNNNIDIDKVAQFYNLISNQHSAKEVRKNFYNIFSDNTSFKIKEDYKMIFKTLVDILIAQIPNYDFTGNNSDNGMNKYTVLDMDAHPHTHSSVTPPSDFKIPKDVDNVIHADSVCAGSNPFRKDIDSAMKTHNLTTLREGLRGLFDWLSTYNTNDAYHSKYYAHIGTHKNLGISMMHTLRLPIVPDLLESLAKADMVNVLRYFVDIIKNPKLLYTMLFVCTPINTAPIKANTPDITSIYLDSENKDISIEELNKKNKQMDITANINLIGVLILNQIAAMFQEMYKTVYHDMYTYYRNDDITLRNTCIVNPALDQFIFRTQYSVFEATKHFTSKVPQILRIPTGCMYNNSTLEHKNLQGTNYDADLTKEEISNFKEYIDRVVKITTYSPLLKKVTNIEMPNILDTTWINIQKEEIVSASVLDTLGKFIDIDSIAYEYLNKPLSIASVSNDINNIIEGQLLLKDKTFINQPVGYLTHFIRSLSTSPITNIAYIERGITKSLEKLWMAVFTVYYLQLSIVYTHSSFMYSNLEETASYNKNLAGKNVFKLEASNYKDLFMNEGDSSYIYINKIDNGDTNKYDRIASYFYYDILHMLHGSVLDTDNILQINYPYTILIDMLTILKHSISITLNNKKGATESNDNVSAVDVIPELIATLLYEFKDMSKTKLNEYIAGFSSYIHNVCNYNTKMIEKDSINTTDIVKQNVNNITYEEAHDIAEMLLSIPTLAFSSEEVDFYKDSYKKVEDFIDKITSYSKDSYLNNIDTIYHILEDINIATLGKLFTIDSTNVIELFENLIATLLRSDAHIQLNSYRYSILANQQTILPILLGNSEFKDAYDIMIKDMIYKYGLTYHTGILSFIISNLINCAYSRSYPNISYTTHRDTKVSDNDNVTIKVKNNGENRFLLDAVGFKNWFDMMFAYVKCL